LRTENSQVSVTTNASRGKFRRQIRIGGEKSSRERILSSDAIEYDFLLLDDLDERDLQAKFTGMSSRISVLSFRRLLYETKSLPFHARVCECAILKMLRSDGPIFRTAEEEEEY